MRMHRFSGYMAVFITAVFLLSLSAPIAVCTEWYAEEAGTQNEELPSDATEPATDENGEIVTGLVTEAPLTGENGEVITEPTLPPYIIVENTTADPDATTEAVTQEPTTLLYAEVTDENGEAVTDENGEIVTELVTEAPLTDENGEIITTEIATEEATEPPVPDALSENGLLLTLAARDADYGYRIVIGQNCSNETGYAAGLLQTTVQKMTGVLLPIVSDATAAQEREICVGKTNRTKKAPVGVSENGFYLHIQGERVYLYSLGEQGAVYAVTAFLKEACGCNWFAAGQTEIPVVNELSVNAKLSLRRGVCFSYTETYGAATDAEFLQMNSLTGGAYTFVTDDGSIALTYLSECTQTLGTRFVSAEKYFETNPEYFALYNNERNPSQLCLSSWDVYAVCLAEIENILRAEWVPAQKQQVVCLSLQQNDVVCQCAQCSALTQQNGSYAGVLLQFLNRISAGLYAGGYSNLQLETYISGNCFTVPSAIKPAENITVRVSAEDRCVGHALNHTACEYNYYFLEMLKLWIGLCDTVYVDLPTENTAHTIGIFADMQHLQTDVQTLYYLGADGLCAADDPSSADCGPALRALRTYLLTRLFADPFCNLNQERKAFLRSWYGDGFAQIAQLVDLLCANAGNAQGHLFAYSEIENSLTLTDDLIAKADRLWDEAMALCTDGRQLLHTEQSRLAWQFWQACCGVGAFSEDADADTATQLLIENLQKAGVSRYSVENETLHLSFLSKNIRPQEWNTPVLVLLAPYLDGVRKAFSVVCVFGMLILGIAAVVRKKLLFIFPLWVYIVLCAVLPWHTESITREAFVTAILTGLLPAGFLGLLCSLSVFAKYTDGRTVNFKRLFEKKTDENGAAATVQLAEKFSLTTENGIQKKEKMRILLAGLVSFVLFCAAYFSLILLPVYTQTTGEQVDSVCQLFLRVFSAICIVILTIRFVLKKK